MIEIRSDGTINDVLYLISRIPEFDQKHSEVDFKNRFKNCKSLILIAHFNGEKVGFKVGYDRFKDGSFYSWIGGVMPNYRRRKIAYSLAVEQEKWARRKDFDRIIVKTRNKYSAMLSFLINNGFKISDMEKRNAINDHRIILTKEI